MKNKKEIICPVCYSSSTKVGEDMDKNQEYVCDNERCKTWFVIKQEYRLE